jgi:hypothetical protein
MDVNWHLISKIITFVSFLTKDLYTERTLIVYFLDIFENIEIIRI